MILLTYYLLIFAVFNSISFQLASSKLPSPHLNLNSADANIIVCARKRPLSNAEKEAGVIDAVF